MIVVFGAWDEEVEETTRSADARFDVEDEEEASGSDGPDSQILMAFQEPSDYGNKGLSEQRERESKKKWKSLPTSEGFGARGRRRERLHVCTFCAVDRAMLLGGVVLAPVPIRLCGPR